jgi:hypothetical protein
MIIVKKITNLMTDTNSQEVSVDLQNNTGEGETQVDTVSIPKMEYEKLNQTLGSLKRELKDLKKSKDETLDNSVKNQSKSPDDNRTLERIEKMALKQANISHEDDITLARNLAKKWNMDIEDVLFDEDFQVKLKRQQDSRSNLEAISNIKSGSSNASQAKNTPEYWIAKGVPPTSSDVPDRKVRATIARAMMNNAKNSKKFYND